MKISIYSTQVIPTNPDLERYGGLELIAGLQAKYFAEKGHEVHLFASLGSYSNDKVKLHAMAEAGKMNPVQAWSNYWGNPQTKQILKDSDIVVDHSWDFFPYSAYNELKNICHCWHGPNPGFNAKPPYETPNLISISFNHGKMMSKMAPGTHWRTVHNGIPLYKYDLNSKPISERDRLLWVSRIYYPKGGHLAVEIANKLEMPIDIVGGSFGDVPAYTNYVKKLCDDSKWATFHGEVDFAKKLEFYRNAKCVILPIVESISNEDSKKYCSIGDVGPNGYWEWHEPFGLITPEANACGTPVVVSPNCGWSETMVHGFNGFFANEREEFAYYVKQVDSIKPENCRKRAEDFDYKIMGENYLRLFNEIIEGRGW